MEEELGEVEVSVSSVGDSTIERLVDEFSDVQPESEPKRYPIFRLRVNKPTAWIEFLKSHEKATTLKALDCLYDACLKNPHLEKKFIERGVTQILVDRLVYSEVALIQAHSLRLLGTLLNSNLFCIEMKKLKELALHLIDVYTLSSVELLQEYSLFVLSVLCNNKQLRRFIVLSPSHDMNVLMERLYSTDPDIQHNTLTLIYSLIQDKYCGQFFVNLEDFSFKPFLMLLKSKYIEVQDVSLNIVRYLIRKNITEMNELFIEEDGINCMFQFLRRFDCRENHWKIFSILRIVLCVDNEVVNLNGSRIKQVVEYIDFIENDEDLIYEDLKLALRLTGNVQNKTKLTAAGISKKLEKLFFMDSCKNIQTISIKLLTEIPVTRIEESINISNMLKKLIEVIDGRKCRGKLARYCTTYIHNLAYISEKLIKQLVTEQQYLQTMSCWLRKGKHLPYSNLHSLLTVYKALSQNTQARGQLISETMFTLLLSYVKFQLKIYSEKLMQIRTCAANIIYNLIESNPAYVYLKYLRTCSGGQAILDILKQTHDCSLIDWISKIIFAFIYKSEALTLHFINIGYLQWILLNQNIWKQGQEMMPLINKFFNNFLPIKFEYMGYLDFHDITKSGFYIQRAQNGVKLKFPMLSDMLAYDADSLRVAYVFQYTKEEIHEKIIDLDSEEDCATSQSRNEIYDFDIKLEKQNRTHLKDEELSDQSILDEMALLNLSQVEIKDKTMSYYVQKVKKEMTSYTRTGVLDPQWIVDNVKMIASIVTEAMGGACTNAHSHKIFVHLNQLKQTLKTCIIPLGELKVGSKLERAMLFKCLADTVGVPNRFVRGAYGSAWNELCLMKWDRPYYDLPLAKLMPTHIVNLWNEPGHLIDIGSKEFDEYCQGPRAEPPILIRPEFPDILKKKDNYDSKYIPNILY